jgi:hypothetical protein
MSRPDFAPYQSAPNAAIVSGFINYGANHEAKTVVSDVYLQQPGKLLRPSTVAKTVTAWQGPEPVWKIPTKDVIQYSERSLVKGSIVEPGLTDGERGHEVTAWAARATPDDLLVQRAMVGFFSTWSLESPEQSVQKLYRVGGGDRAKAPLVRHRLYDLLWNSATDHSIESLNEVMVKEGHHPKTLREKLEGLDQEGIVEVRSKSIGYNPLMRVTDSEYRHVAISFLDTSLETQAAYAAAQELGINATITVDEFVDKATKLMPDAAPVVLRKYLIGSFSEGTNHFPGLQLVDRLGIPISDLSVVKLSPDVRQAAGELVVGVSKILAGEDLQKYAKDAQQIMDNPAKVRELIAKAGKFSAVKAGHFHGSVKLTNQMKSILETGPQTAESMRVELVDRYGRMIGHERIHSILNELVKTENVGTAYEPVHPHSAIAHKVYKMQTLVEERH